MKEHDSFKAKQAKKAARKAVKAGKSVSSASLKSMMPWYILVFLFAFLLYANTLGHKYVLDDNGAIKTNWVVKKGLEGIPLILKTPYRYGVSMLEDNLYRPLSLVMFAVEWQIAPGNPMLNHLVNVLFYALTSVLLLIVLSLLFHNANPAFPLFACLLWMVHPIHTEVVANIKSRDEIMSVFFLLLSVLWFIRYLNEKKNWLITASLISFFLALMSKEGAITFLLILPLMAWYLSEKNEWTKVRVALFYLAPALLYLLIRQAVLNAWAQPSPVTLLDNLLVSAPDAQSRLATAILLLGKYLLVFIAPVQLVSDYSYNQIPVTRWTDPYVLISFAIYTAALVFAFLRLKERSFYVFGIIWFLVSMSIYSNLFVLIGSSFAERFLYLPSIGLCMLIAALIMLASNSGERDKYQLSFNNLFTKLKVPVIILLLIMTLFSIKTISRNSDWKDEYTLFSVDSQHSPNSAHMRNYWGSAIRDKAKEEKDSEKFKAGMAKALVEFRKAVEIYPAYADAWQQMGLAYFRLGDIDRSLESYQKAISFNPGLALTYTNMGIIFFQKGDYQKAIGLYKKSIELDPNYADAYCNLGSSYGMIGEYTAAVENFHKCLDLEPENARACYYLGITYKSMNNISESRRYLEKAAQLDPSYAK